MFELEASHKLSIQSHTRCRERYAEVADDRDYDEGISPVEASSSGHVVNAYQCSQTVLKTNTEKHLPRQNDHYNLRSKRAPPTLGEMSEKIRLLIRKVDPPAAPKKKT